MCCIGNLGLIVYYVYVEQSIYYLHKIITLGWQNNSWMNHRSRDGWGSGWFTVRTVEGNMLWWCGGTSLSGWLGNASAACWRTGAARGWAAGPRGYMIYSRTCRSICECSISLSLRGCSWRKTCCQCRVDPHIYLLTITHIVMGLLHYC